MKTNLFGKCQLNNNKKDYTSLTEVDKKHTKCTICILIVL